MRQRRAFLVEGTGDGDAAVGFVRDLEHAADEAGTVVHDFQAHAAAFAGLVGRPLPLSVTRRMTRSSFSSISMVTRVAPPWRVALLSDSWAMR